MGAIHFPCSPWVLIDDIDNVDEGDDAILDDRQRHVASTEVEFQIAAAPFNGFTTFKIHWSLSSSKSESTSSFRRTPASFCLVLDELGWVHFHGIDGSL